MSRRRLHTPEDRFSRDVAQLGYVAGPFCVDTTGKELGKHPGKNTFCLRVCRECRLQSPWHLSLMYTSHVSLLVRTALNFGKQTALLKFYNSKSDKYAIICGVKKNNKCILSPV